MNTVSLDSYLSIRQIENQQVNYLDLHRCLRQNYIIESISNPKSVAGISVAGNYLIQMPNFVSDYTNLIELNGSHNELNTIEWILYRTEASENDKPKSSRPLVHPFLQIINLSFNHIKTVPANIHYLRFLHTLDLSYNYLTTLPTSIGALEQLRVLLLDHNRLKILPNTFTRLSHLETLNLSFNQFQSIDTFKNLSNLKHFYMNSNPLQTFPLLLYTCSNLQHISLSNIQLQRINEITLDYFTQFPQLKRLDLSKNHLTNDFLSSIKQFFDLLEELYLHSNQLTNIFSLLSHMKSLQLLDLSSNSLSKIPQDVHAKLEVLRLSTNQIELSSTDCVHLQHLIQLDLDHNQVSNIPKEFLACAQLQILNISSNPLRKFPEILFQLPSLNHLTFNDSNLHDLNATSYFQKHFFRTLNFLDLSYNNLHTNLHQLTVLKALTYLDLSGNCLTELDQNFRTLICLKILKIGQNKFENFPAWLYEMDETTNRTYIGEILSELYMNDNLVEFIPDEIVHMTNLQTLDLSNNKFTRFPDPLIYLDQLTCLIYSQQHGIHIDKLPDDFIHLYNLQKLDLSYNIFREIPPCVYSLTKLEYLDMSDNLLTALDTDRLRQLTNLKMVKLNGNLFPSFPSTLYQIDAFRINDNALCLAPPNDFLEGKSSSVASHMFVQVNDQYENELFRIYKRIFVEHLSTHDFERLLIRLNLPDTDIAYFRKNYHQVKQEEKVDVLLRMWKQKRGSLADSETLFKLAQLIGDKKLVQHFQRAYLLARKNSKRSVWQRLYRTPTRSSFRHSVDYCEKNAPVNNLDFRLRTCYDHAKETFASKARFVVQLETICQI
ncbi:unnamed protein product [Adineta ricciae]|uniref:Death domain-containing protein n=1 Tax=Adineta ricciae TaxID=249248 RepID=A0A814AWN5_ADIRI|nr:unnamed protein product [Adineta ricciae]